MQWASTALLSQVFQGMQIISPFIAGALVAWAGAKACYYADTVSFFLSAMMIASVTSRCIGAMP